MVTFLSKVNVVPSSIAYTQFAPKSTSPPSSALSNAVWMSAPVFSSPSARTASPAASASSASATASIPSLDTASSATASADTVETEIAINNTKRRDKNIFLFIIFLLNF